MNIVVETSTSIVKYAGDDYTLLPDKIEVRKSGVLAFVVGDMNSSNAEIVEVDSVPADYVGGKYLYTGGAFTTNPGYAEPDSEE